MASLDDHVQKMEAGLVSSALQVVVVCFHSVCIILFIFLFIYLCTKPELWPLLAPYIAYVALSNAHTSGKLDRRSTALRSSYVWTLFASYFPARLHRSHELSPTRKYIFGYHPHGIICHGAFAAFGTEALGFAQLFPGITNTFLILEGAFRIPFYRDYALMLGLAGVSEKSCHNLLSSGGLDGNGQGRAITIAVGGARESLIAYPKSLGLMIKDRKGFIKLAARNGADLVPILAFGENDLYDQIRTEEHPAIKKFQLLMKSKTGWTMPLFYGQGLWSNHLGMLPYRRPLNIVVGKPIELNIQKEPTASDVDRIHKLYMVELESMWENWSPKFVSGSETKFEIL